MQDQVTAPDGAAVPSQDPTLAERIDVLESEAEHAFYRADYIEAKLNASIDAQMKLTKLYDAIEALLVDVAKPTTEEDR